MLIRPCQPVKQRRLSAVLIARKSKGQNFAFRKNCALWCGMVFSHLSKPRMFYFAEIQHTAACLFFITCRLNLNLFGIVKSQSKFVSPNPVLNGIPHGRCFYICNGFARNQSHIEEVLPQRAASSHG